VGPSISIRRLALTTLSIKGELAWTMLAILEEAAKSSLQLLGREANAKEGGGAAQLLDWQITTKKFQNHN
jgi:hypothetical protein